MSTVPHWSGREVRALREARRMSVREFAAHLGVSDRMVSKWEAGGESIHPRPTNQAALDTSLAMAGADVRTRFNRAAAGRTVHIESIGPGDGVRHLVRHPVDGKLMTLVEAGKFGSGWLVGYYIDIFPTTSAEYIQFVTATGHRPPAQWPDGQYRPTLAASLVHVPWVDAQAYAAWASKALPTPVQWERAAKGDEGMVKGHLAEWCVGARGAVRHAPAVAVSGPGPGGGPTAFRCAAPAAEVLGLLSI